MAIAFWTGFVIGGVFSIAAVALTLHWLYKRSGQASNAAR